MTHRPPRPMPHPLPMRLRRRPPGSPPGRHPTQTSALLIGLALIAGCGARSDSKQSDAGNRTDASSPEICNGLDEDLDSAVDEDFRDANGSYVDDAHCGGCDQACKPSNETELESSCAVDDTGPRCTATRCIDGYVPDRRGGCSPRGEGLCLPCEDDASCGSIEGARCVNIGGQPRCATPCTGGCPEGYGCSERQLCEPLGNSCLCNPGQNFELACAITPDEAPTNSDGPPPLCLGRAFCAEGVQSACLADLERCDTLDNDCDGRVDEDFIDAQGFYRVDPSHCGGCGVSCLEGTGSELQLACGGDPFAPICVLACPDTLDGLQAGDGLDADGDIATGCECIYQQAEDLPGPVGAQGEALDSNCDGVDGVITRAYYVAGDGNDAAAGSPTRPLRSIAEALRRASLSLEGETPRGDVFVAAGTYTESLSMPDGVRLHGGYRRDFKALDPEGYRTVVRAPAGTDAPGGAALQLREVGSRETVVRWLSLRGRDATAVGQATVGVYVKRPGAALQLRSLQIEAGVPGQGQAGGDGPAGVSEKSPAGTGAPPRAAIENNAGACIAGPLNEVQGGAGATRICGTTEVSGGDGGRATCPLGVTGTDANAQGTGDMGKSSPQARGGAGGRGGQDSEGPIENEGWDDSVPGCSGLWCCGLADLRVPVTFQGPSVGLPGQDAPGGLNGTGCADPMGRFDLAQWSGASGLTGGDGGHGGGGGGGGAGGGTLFRPSGPGCNFADGLGGGGGGGGAGGCGGTGGTGGGSGAPSIGLLLDLDGTSTLPLLESVLLVTSPGGRGGHGGAGGDAEPGQTGGFGTDIPAGERNTPTLAGPFAGARGGKGGDGGSGGGGGGGCGGSSVGLWVVGGSQAQAVSLRGGLTFTLATGGQAGQGGGGAAPGSSGTQGRSVDVHAQ